MRQLAGFFPANEHPNVLIGLGEPDDAALYLLDDTRALISTTDFFTPIVDDPWTFGAIAAANAMSDVYAMGGEVLSCLNLAGFPDDLDDTSVAQIFAGGAAKVREAGAAITGGHTVTNPEPFYGLSVTGLAHPEHVLRKGAIQPEDRLFLTKPLGTGIITTAAKLTGPGEARAQRLSRRAQGKPDADPVHLEAAVQSMLRLNRAAAQAAQRAKAKSATDITGFGLLGHAAEMVRNRQAQSLQQQASATCLHIQAAAVPTLPGVWDYIRAGYLTRGSTRNPEAYGDWITFASHIEPAQRSLLWEAETSGGLLIAVAPDQAPAFVESCIALSQPYWEIGYASQAPTADEARVHVI